MDLVADEGVEKGIVDRLRLDGHSVVYIAESARQAIDPDILEGANERGALLLTADKDFGQLIFQQRSVHAGVILVRLSGLPNSSKADIISRSIRERGDEMLGAFTVISPGLLRIRSRDLS